MADETEEITPAEAAPAEPEYAGPAESDRPFVASQDREQHFDSYDGPEQGWSKAFAREHDGRPPKWEDYYDHLWSVEFAGQHNRPPTLNDWRTHYYVKYKGETPEDAVERVRYETKEYTYSGAQPLYTYTDSKGPWSVDPSHFGWLDRQNKKQEDAATTAASTAAARAAVPPAAPRSRQGEGWDQWGDMTQLRPFNPYNSPNAMYQNLGTGAPGLGGPLHEGPPGWEGPPPNIPGPGSRQGEGMDVSGAYPPPPPFTSYLNAPIPNTGVLSSGERRFPEWGLPRQGFDVGEDRPGPAFSLPNMNIPIPPPTPLDVPAMLGNALLNRVPFSRYLRQPLALPYDIVQDRFR